MPAEYGSCSMGWLGKIASSRLAWLEGGIENKRISLEATTTTFSSVVFRHATRYASMTRNAETKATCKEVVQCSLGPLYHEDGTALDGYR